jgi:hypothetical protein
VVLFRLPQIVRGPAKLTPSGLLRLDASSGHLVLRMNRTLLLAKGADSASQALMTR